MDGSSGADPFALPSSTFTRFIIFYISALFPYLQSLGARVHNLLFSICLYVITLQLLTIRECTTLLIYYETIPGLCLPPTPFPLSAVAATVSKIGNLVYVRFRL